MEKLLISNSPHIRSKVTTKGIMIDVLIALAPALIMSVVYFGLNALCVILLASVSAVAAEWIYKLILKKTFKEVVNEFDFTSLVTGVLIAMNMPSTVLWKGWYVPIIASVFAIVVVKMLFGGTGKNFVNPAIAGRIMVFLSFSSLMTSGWVNPSIGAIFSTMPETGSTVLTGSVLTHSIENISSLDLLLGTGVAGCLGETCKIALILGGAYLVIKKVIDLKPLIYIAIVGVMTVAFNGWNFGYFLPSILSGGLILGAIFMATDYVTCPNTTIGSYIYFVLLGVLTAWLRQRNGMEVVSFVILIGNICSPLIDRFVIPKPFGYEKPEKKKAEKGGN